MLRGKKVILGITGSIAAYKAAYIVRGLVREEAEVKVIMTRAAQDFISPLTLSTLSGHSVISGMFSEGGDWNQHVALGHWADLLVIAPASAHTIARVANGICNDMLTAVYLSAECPVCFAPAMDREMYRHPSIRNNIDKLLEYGNLMIPPGTGELASGLHGEGRMAEPEEILGFLERESERQQELVGKKVLVTAGPTYEAIDPVRFIGNHSSGKMGYALAEAAARRGAEVILVSGPTALRNIHPSIDMVKVTTASEMAEACQKIFPECDAIIMAAAVADQRPRQMSREKLKKDQWGREGTALELEPTPDILALLGADKKEGQVLVGFALETKQEEENAKQKLKKKGLDLIVLNSLRDEEAGFGGDLNKVTLFDRNNNREEYPLLHKRDVAEKVVDRVVVMLIP